MKISIIGSPLLATLLVSILVVGTKPVAAFQVGGSLSWAATRAKTLRVPATVEVVRPAATPSPSTTTTRLQSTRKDESICSNGNGWFDGITINPLYLVPYVSFISFAVYATMSEPAGASQVILDKFITDPIHPGVNELFATVFNLIGLV